MGKNELLNGKVCRLRTRIRSLKREMKGKKTKSREREKALKAVINGLDERLASADLLTSMLKASLRESGQLAVEQNDQLLQEKVTICGHQTRLQQLEEMVAAQRLELQRVHKLVQWERTELRRTKEFVEKQTSELRVADEETVNQLEQLQRTFADLKQQELALKEAKELSETRRERVAKLKEQITVVFRQLPQIEEKLLTERSNNCALQEKILVVNSQLQASREIEEQATESSKVLELKNQQLLDENKRLSQELETLKLLSKRDGFAQAELENTLRAQSKQQEQFEHQIKNLKSKNTELQRYNFQILYELNTAKKSQPTKSPEGINLQSKTATQVGRSGVNSELLQDARSREPGFVVETSGRKSVFPMRPTTANVITNEIKASEILRLMSECSQLKAMVRKFESENQSLLQRTDAEKEVMRREIDCLIEEGLRKDKELEMLESSLEEMGKVKNNEIMNLRQANRRIVESSARFKEEMRKKEEEIAMALAVIKRPKNRWFGGRQQ